MQSNYAVPFRKVAMLLTIAMLVVALSACTNVSDNANIVANEEAVQEVTTEQANEIEEQEYKTVTTVDGDIEIPVQAKKIVAEEYLGSLIALGVIPVGAPGLTLKNVYFKEALAGVEDTGDYGQMSPEKIISLEPDLIISGSAQNYEGLSKIAPTITIPYGELKNAHEELTYFGKLLGKEKEAEEWLATYDKTIAEAKQKVDDILPADASFSILEKTSKSTYVYGDNFGRGGQAIYQALGRKPPAAVADEIMVKQWAEISEETLAQYAGDYLIITSNEMTVEDFKADPVWATLPAIQSDQFFVWKEEVSWYYDPIAILNQTEQLTNWLVELNQSE